MAGAKPVLQHIKQQQIKWFGHITSMPINQPALRVYNTKYSGWRARGRPRKRWSDSVADTLRTQGMSLLQSTRLAADRQLCPPATPTGTSGRNKVKVSKVSVARAVFWTLDGSSRARLYVDLAKEIGDVSVAAEIDRRSQHQE